MTQIEKMNFFTHTELLTTKTSTEVEKTTKEVTSTTKPTTKLTTKLTTELTTKLTTELPTEKSLIPIEESKKDIILLAALGTLVLGLVVMVVFLICRKRRLRTKAKQNLELFENLAASSSTTVFDKDQ